MYWRSRHPLFPSVGDRRIRHTRSRTPQSISSAAACTWHREFGNGDGELGTHFVTRLPHNIGHRIVAGRWKSAVWRARPLQCHVCVIHVPTKTLMHATPSLVFKMSKFSCSICRCTGALTWQLLFLYDSRKRYKRIKWYPRSTEGLTSLLLRLRKMPHLWGTPRSSRFSFYRWVSRLLRRLYRVPVRQGRFRDVIDS